MAWGTVKSKEYGPNRGIWAQSMFSWCTGTWTVNYVGLSSLSLPSDVDFCPKAAKCCHLGVDEYGWIAAAVGWGLWFLTLILFCIDKLMKLRPDEPKHLRAWESTKAEKHLFLSLLFKTRRVASDIHLASFAADVSKDIFEQGTAKMAWEEQDTCRIVPYCYYTSLWPAK